MASVIFLLKPFRTKWQRNILLSEVLDTQQRHCEMLLEQQIILGNLGIFILILTKDNTNFEMISVYLVFLQLGIMVLTIIPTEFLLHKHFTKQGMKK